MSLLEALRTQVTRSVRDFVDPVGRTTQVSRHDPSEVDIDLEPGAGTFGNSLWSFVAAASSVAQKRQVRYEEYDEMDREFPEFASALDIYADNATRGDSGGDTEVVIQADDDRVQRELEALFERIDAKGMIWTLTRDVAKYGEQAEEVVVDDANNVVRLKPLKTSHIIPQYDRYGRLPARQAYHQIDDQGEVVAKFDRWQVAYPMNKKSRRDKFGTGIGYSIRRVFKLLRLMEEALVVARLTRAHNRFAFILGVEGMTPPERSKHIRKIKNGLKKKPITDSRTGRINDKANPLNVEHDLFLTTSKDAPSDVKVLQGDLTIGNLEDVEYFLQKAFSGLKVPKAYLAHERDTKARAVITEQDIQFARSVRRLQFVIQEMLTQIAELQLKLKGIDPRTVTFTVSLPEISTIDELRIWQTEQLKQLSARMFKQNFWASDEFILRNYLRLSEEEITELMRDQNPPDEYNGLLDSPQVGSVANDAENGQVGQSEALTARGLEALEKFMALDPDQMEEVLVVVETSNGG